MPVSSSPKDQLPQPVTVSARFSPNAVEIGQLRQPLVQAPEQLALAVRLHARFEKFLVAVDV